MALYRWSTKLAGIWAWFNPTNLWTNGQVLTRNSNWYGYADAPVTSVNSQTWAVTINAVPSWWEEWQVLTRTENWYGWADGGWWWGASSVSEYIEYCKTQGTKTSKYMYPWDSRTATWPWIIVSAVIEWYQSNISAYINSFDVSWTMAINGITNITAAYLRFPICATFQKWDVIIASWSSQSASYKPYLEIKYWA